MLEDILQALHPETYLCIATIYFTNRIYQNEESICLEKKTSICTIDLHFIIHKCSFVALLIILYIWLSKWKKMKIKKRDVLIY
jgi:hypothetical protein